MKNTIENLVREALRSLESEAIEFVVEHPDNLKFGDYSTNAGIITGRSEEIKDYIEKHKPVEVEKLELAGPGFINFYLSKDFFHRSIEEIVDMGESYGRNNNLKGKKVIIEYTDANPFKEFHIGHLMNNTIGEAVSRLVEWSGAEVRRACYQGDVGLHVAKAIWGMLNRQSTTDNKQWARAYVQGTMAYEEDSMAKKEIQEINKKIYERSDEEINQLYDQGRKESLEAFDAIYKKLGTKFDYLFFESETAVVGKKIVEANLDKIFEKSDGAIVFRAEMFNPKLHTRVFINSEGLPTYEAKELGLVSIKYNKYPYDKSIVITGNEINEYFKVLLEAMSQIFPDLALKTVHLSHGILRLSSGKMSSRTGDVITAEELIAEVKNKTEDNEDVAIGAIKYMILRQSVGGDIVFDFEKSVSTEGDSGVYLQYAYARAGSILEKAESQGLTFESREVRLVERLLYRFPEIVERASKEYAPSHIVNYLTELASSFNNFYAREQVISDDPESAYRLAITKAFYTVMKNGLALIAIPAPDKI
jgi:arginyl-tRNA synthetase